MTLHDEWMRAFDRTLAALGAGDDRAALRACTELRLVGDELRERDDHHHHQEA